MEESMRIRILGDAAGAQTAFQQVETAANIAARKITGSFEHLGSLFKRTIGFAGIAYGVDQALESASKLINAQKAQSQLLSNQAKQQGSLIKLADYQLEGSKDQYQWKSKTLDQMATQLSLSNAISKQDIVMAQNRQLTNTDLLKFYAKGNADLAKHNATFKDIVAQSKLHGENMNGTQAAMATTLTTAANLAEVTGQGINGSMMMLTRLMADPAKRMSAMSRMGIQIAKSDQDRIKQLEKQKGLVAAQGALLNVLDKTYHGIAVSAASPVEILKNALQNIWTALGEGLMPVLESLSSVVIDVVTPLLPVLQSMGKLIEEVAKKLGTSLGSLLSDLVPFIDLIVKGLLPAFLNLITPLVEMADKAITPLVHAFAQLVGEGDKIGPLSQMFLDMGDNIAKNLKPAVDFVAKSFDDMTKSGDLQKMMQSIFDVFKALAPLLPSLATSFAKLVIAITPAFIAALPTIVTAFKMFTQLLVAFTPLLTKAADGLSKLIGWIMGNKGLKGAIGMLMGIWFTRKLFLTPLMLIGDTIGKVITSIGRAGGAMRGLGGTFKGLFSGGFGGASTARADYFGSVAAKYASKAESARLMGFTGRASRYGEKAKAFAEKEEAMRNRISAVGTAGGGFKGFLKNIFGVGLGTSFAPKNQLDATNENTQALIQLTEAMKMGAGGTLAGGFGTGSSGTAAKKAMTIEERLAASMRSGRYDTIAAERKAIVAKFGAGAGAHLNQFDQATARAKAMLDAERAASSVSAYSPAKMGRFARMGNFLKNDFGAFRGQVGGMFGKLGSMGSSLAGKFGGLSMGAKGALGGLATAGISMAMPLLAKVMPKSVANIAGGAMQGASMGMMFGPWGAAIGGAIGLVKSLFQNCKPFHDFVVKIGHKLMEWGKIIWKYVSPIVKKIGGFIKDYIVFQIHNLVGAVKIVIGVFKMLWNIAKSVASGIATAFVRVANAIIHIINAVIHVINALIRAYNFLPGHKDIKTIGTIGTMKAPKFHSGGIVPGRRGAEVPAILQAGEAVLSLNQMRRGGGIGGNHLNVHPGAVSIVVNGNADAATTAEIKRHVEAQFKELHRTLKSMGR